VEAERFEQILTGKNRLRRMKMRQDVDHRVVYAKPDNLSDDFALLFEAHTDAFRGMSTRPF
jgi:hypothetical protein